MEESPPTISQPNPTPPSSSLTDRLSNVFISPGEVFDEVKVSPPNPANWAVPLVLAIVAGIVYSMVVFSQPAILQQMREAQERRFQQMVVTGKLTQAKADQMSEATDKFMSPAVFKVIGIAGSCFAVPAFLFLVALILWLLGRFAFHTSFEYLKAVEVVGLAHMISVLGAIIAMLLAVIYGNVSMTPGPVLLLSHFDPANKLHVMLSAVNLSTLWFIGVVSLGLARLCGTSFTKVALWGYGVWAVFGLGPLFLLGLLRR